MTTDQRNTAHPIDDKPGDRYTDLNGHEWHIRITVADLERVKAECDGIDLLDLVDPESEATARLANVYNLAAVLWTLLRPEAERRGISPEEYASGLAGDALNAAKDAMLEALAGFFPDPQRRRMLRQVWRLMREADATLTQAVQNALNNALAELSPGSISGNGQAD